MSTREELLLTLVRADDSLLDVITRFLTRLLAPDEFITAYITFLDANGGADEVGLARIVQFMDEWEATHE